MTTAICAVAVNGCAVAVNGCAVAVNGCADAVLEIRINNNIGVSLIVPLKWGRLRQRSPG